MQRLVHVVLPVVAVVIGAVVVAAPSAHATTSVSVPCGSDSHAVANAIASVNVAGGGSVILAPHCTYPVNKDNTVDGGNGFPVITTPVTIYGQQSEVTSYAAGFRAFDVSSTLTVFDLDIDHFYSGNLGGAAVWTHPGATTNLTRVAIIGNHAVGGNGGGIRNNGTTHIVDSLIARNVTEGASTVGAGVSNGQGTVTITGSTVSDNLSGNTAGGVWAYSSTTVAGSLIIRNASPSTNDDCGQAVTDGGYNLAGDTSCGLSGTSQQGIGTGVAQFPGDNGGFLPTDALDPLVNGSPNPAVDAIPSADSLCTGTDERGVARPSGNGCDIGSFEVGPATITATGVKSIFTGNAFAAHVTVAGPAGLYNAPVPTGTVTLTYGATTFATADLSSGVATLTTSALPVGQDTILVNYSGDAVYGPGSMSFVVVVAMRASDYAGWTAQFPDGRGSASAVITACGPGGPNNGYNVGVFSSNYPHTIGAFVTCGASGAGLAVVADGVHPPTAILVSAGDRVRVSVAENGTTLWVSAADPTNGQSISRSSAAVQPALTIGAAFVFGLDGPFPPAHFSSAMVDGYPLGFDPATPVDAKAGSVTVRTMPVSATGLNFTVQAT